MKRKTHTNSTSSGCSNNRTSNLNCGCFNCRLFKRKNQNLTNQSIVNNEEELECLNVTSKNEIDKMNDLILDSLSLKESNVDNFKNKCNTTNKAFESALNELKSKYVHGLVKVQDSSGIMYNQDGNLYLNFKFDNLNKENEIDTTQKLNENLRDIPKLMSLMWNMKSPQIIIPVITGLTNFKNWKNQKLEEQFRRGLIKAANKTEMWFITNGINGGISAMMGDAFYEEKSCRSTHFVDNESSNYASLSYLNQNETPSKPLTLLGIVAASCLQNWSSFDGNTSLITASGNRINGKSNYRFDINPDHTHFIIYDDISAKKETTNLNTSLVVGANPTPDDLSTIDYDLFRNMIESLFTRSLSYYKRKLYDKNDNNESDDDFDFGKPLSEHTSSVPMVCLVIRGDLKSIDTIEYKINKQIPVIILKGSGAVADIISFAYDETTENKDPSYEDSFIRPEIAKKLLNEFNDELGTNDVMRNLFRDKIISIVKNASKGERKFLNIVDMKGLTFDFGDLDKYILTALLQSQTQLSGKQGKAQLDRNLRLTLDWNCPALALSEIFQRDDYTQIEIKHSIFERALLRLDREDFVELFLDQGFYIHRYLGRNNIRDLFTKSENREFFVTVILQGILGHFTNELPENFLPDGLNEVLKQLTNIDNMINILEIYMNQLGVYVHDAQHAEKKGLNFLIIFAIIFNRHKLAKMLWKRSDNPLTVALFCSLLYKNLLPFCQENYLKSQIEKYQNYFANAAIGVLDASFQDNDPRSYAILTTKQPDWNDCTVLELAYNAKNLDFIAHPCCQKILTKRLLGSIQIRENERNAFIEIPNFVKVILSAFLVFPMYYWIVFPIKEVDASSWFNKSKRKKENKDSNNQNESKIQILNDMDDDEKDEELVEAQDTKAELNKKLIEAKKNKSQHDIGILKINAIHHGQKKYVTPPIWEKIYLVWTSPFTKFWVNFISYIFFLILFGLVTLWPCCGNLILDSVLWIWTASLVVEDTRIAYKNFLTGSQLPMTGPIIEIGIMISFLLAFFVVRIAGSWNHIELIELMGFDRIFVSKVVLCVYLIYFYYRTLFVYLPISHKLGPMLVRIKLMVVNDFFTYLRLFLIFGTAGSIALNSIIYPFHPINYELFKRVFLFRGFVQLFAADKLDLERKTEECKLTNYSHRFTKPYTCINLTDGIDFEYPEMKLNKYGATAKCNYMSLTGWLILIQYFILIKLFLPSLLTAMFSATSSRVSAQSEQLWMYQRYQIVLEYEKRLVFPAPFTFIIYIFKTLQWIFSRVFNLFSKCKVCCKFRCKKHNLNSQKPNSNDTGTLLKQSIDSINQINNKQNMSTYNYWKNIAQTYSQDSEKDAKEKAKQKQMETNLNKVREDLTTQKKSLQRLNDRVVGLEKFIIQNQSYLEQIKNLLSQRVSKSGLLDRKKSNYIHILSRESPYLKTNIPRFFVYEKLVPWECPLELYDPPFISLSFDQFKVDKIFIDEEFSKNEPAPPPQLPPQSPSMNQKQISEDSSQTVVPATPQISRMSGTDIQESGRTGRKKSNTSESSKQQIKQNIYLWNSIILIDNPLQLGKKITIDRKSWITKLDEKSSQMFPIIYSLDALGYPKNPMGRTGVRGRGALERYGPNHEISVIVTRWKKQKNRPIYVERRKLLEFIAVKDPLTGLTKIPGERILGDESKYSVVCRTFMELVFEENDVERGFNFEEDDMLTFFASFASKTPIDLSMDSGSSNISDSQAQKLKHKQVLSELLNELGFISTMIYCGYIDDPRNTDVNIYF